LDPKDNVQRFVKYKNRKLHRHGDRTSYVTMEQLLEVVAFGVPVEVTDDVTGEDITAFVLARLVYDRCRFDKRAYKVFDLQKLIMSSPPPKVAA
jgi:polyhydroxyalkanoate synthesis regulator protein